MRHYRYLHASSTPLSSEENDARLAAKRFPPSHAIESMFERDAKYDALTKILFDGGFVDIIACCFGGSPAVVDSNTRWTVLELGEAWLFDKEMEQDLLVFILENVLSTLREIISRIC